MNILEKNLINKISLNGPICLDDFMDMVIKYYYSHNSAIGSDGDFITAPEISQMFGEIIGIYFANCWLEEGKDMLSIVELGPGRGTLMKDFLRATKNIKDFHQSIGKIYLLEQSAKMRLIQQENLAEYASVIKYIDNLNEIDPKHKIYIIANEFFDCLPIRAQTVIDGIQYEIFIGYEDKFHYLAVPCTKGAIDCKRIENLSIINIMEIGDRYIPYTKSISQLLKQFKGSRALIIDYGYIGNSSKSTIQAVKKHKYHNVLEDIGSCDITALVNFKALGDLFSQEHIAYKIETQAEFLLRNAIQARALQLKNNAKDPAAIDKALHRLIGKEEMGDLFKVLIAVSN